MDATLYTGIAGGTQSITNQYGFKPDLVWTKVRSGTGDNFLNDSVRGAANILVSNTTGAESNLPNYVTAFNSNGFSLGTSSYTSTGNTVVGWQWQAGQGTTSSNTSGSITSTVSANATAGFSVVTYTGNEVQGATVGHGLGVAPSFIIIKDRTSAQNWVAWQTTLGASNFLQLNTTAAQSSAAPMFNGVAPSSTVITLAGGAQSDRFAVNKSGDAYVAYCWSEIAGFSQFGSYTGNGSADGPFVYTNFRPSFILQKRSSGVDNWMIHDTRRNPYNLADARLMASSSDAESTSDNQLDILSNGFKMRSTNTATNQSGETYIYMAFAENPFKFSTAR